MKVSTSRRIDPSRQDAGFPQEDREGASGLQTYFFAGGDGKGVGQEPATRGPGGGAGRWWAGVGWGWEMMGWGWEMVGWGWGGGGSDRAASGWGRQKRPQPGAQGTVTLRVLQVSP